MSTDSANPTTECDECSNIVPSVGSTVSTHHQTSCSLHPANVVDAHKSDMRGVTITGQCGAVLSVEVAQSNPSLGGYGGVICNAHQGEWHVAADGAAPDHDNFIGRWAIAATTDKSDMHEPIQEVTH